MNILSDLILNYPALSVCADDIHMMYDTLACCFEIGGRLFICGNGGSAADALHITGELMKSFVRKRAVDEVFSARLRERYPLETDELIKGLQGALPVYPLVENAALSTAYANDEDAGFVFAQQVYGYARTGDAVLGISTSGDSKNIIRALMTAKGRGAHTLGLTGNSGGIMINYCDVCVRVPETETYKIQELHLPVYHALCLALEERFW